MSGQLTFAPRPEDEIVIGGVSYRFVRLGNRVHRIKGREAVVFHLMAPGEREYALKVFTSQAERDPVAVRRARKLALLPPIEGITVRERVVLSSKSDGELLKRHNELSYAVMMPWIPGDTWSELAGAMREQERSLAPKVALHLTRAFVEILRSFEQEGIAHCDISAVNVIIRDAADASPIQRIEFVDLEQMHSPELDAPVVKTMGSFGYSRADNECIEWSKEGDRYAGAVMIGEFFGYCHSLVVAASASENSYFRQGEVGTQCPRYRLLIEALRTVGGRVADRFDEAWNSRTLGNCPTFDEWYLALPDRLREVPNLAGDSHVARDAARDIAKAEGGLVAERIGRALPAQSKVQDAVQRTSWTKLETKKEGENGPSDGAVDIPPPEPDPMPDSKGWLVHLLKYATGGVIGLVVLVIAGRGVFALLGQLLLPPIDLPTSSVITNLPQPQEATPAPPIIDTPDTIGCATIEQRNGQLVGEASGGSQMWNARLEPDRLTSVTLRQTDFPCTGVDRMGFVVHTRGGTVNSSSQEACVWTATFESGDGGLTPISLFYKEAGDTTGFELAVSCATSLSGG